MTECKENVITTRRLELFENVKNPITYLPIPYVCHLGATQISNIRLGKNRSGDHFRTVSTLSPYLSATVLRRTNRDTIDILKWGRNSLGVVFILPCRFYKNLLWSSTITMSLFLCQKGFLPLLHRSTANLHTWPCAFKNVPMFFITLYNMYSFIYKSDSIERHCKTVWKPR